MSEYVYAGLTSQTVDIFVRDSSSGTGQGLTGLAYNSGSLVASYRKGATGTRTAITLATQTVGGAWSSGGFVEIDATNMPGCYRLDLPNAAVDTAGFVTVFLKGATNMVPVALRIDCRPVPADLKQIGADAQSATDLKDFADAGYDPSTNAVTAVLDSAAILAVADQVWDEAMSGHTTAGTYGGRIVRATNSNNEVQITGSNHIAADIHDFQTGVITAGDFAANAITASALATDAVTEIQSGLATSSALAAAKTILDKVDTGLAVDGAVYQFTANMLELGPSGGGGSSVNVLPATGIVSDRSAGTTLLPVVGETISQSITVYQSDGTTAVSLSGKTLKVIFETMSGVDVAVVLAADITISGASSNVVTFAYPAAVTASERTLRFAIRDAAAPLTMYLQGVCSVVAAPKVDA